mgnify:CR=1 FL=1
MNEEQYKINQELEEIRRFVEQMPKSAFLDAIDNARKHRYDFEGTLDSGVILRDLYGNLVLR